MGWLIWLKRLAWVERAAVYGDRLVRRAIVWYLRRRGGAFYLGGDYVTLKQVSRP